MQRLRYFRRATGVQGSRRAGLSAVSIILSLLVVALATIAVGSTIVAKRASDARDQARQDFAAAARALDALTEGVAGSKPLKKELLEPSLAYYQQFVKTHTGDPQLRPELASANFHLAGLHAKMGSKEALPTMTAGLVALDDLAREEGVDPSTLPSLQDAALKVTTPLEWFMVKGADQQYQMNLVVNVERARNAYGGLSRKFPQDVSFRDNHAALLKVSALITSQIRRQGAAAKTLEHWLAARDVLESLVKDQPANKDYQVRLAESLMNAARLQKTSDQKDKAIANVKRAIEVREQMAAAYPDDKTIKSDLTTAQRELTNLEAAPAETPAATVAEKKDAPAEGASPASPAEEKKDAPAEKTESPAADAVTETKDAPPEAPAPTDKPETPAGEAPPAATP
jgi:hypothetical protein